MVLFLVIGCVVVRYGVMLPRLSKGGKCVVYTAYRISYKYALIGLIVEPCAKSGWHDGFI